MNYQYVAPFATSEDQQSIIKVLDAQKMINGKSYYELSTSLISKGVETPLQTNFSRSGENGSIYGMKDASSPEVLLFPEEPWEVQQSWESNDNGVQSVSTILDFNGEIDTPNGKLTGCLVIEAVRANSTSKAYLQEGVGLVAVTILTDGKEMLFQYLLF